MIVTLAVRVLSLLFAAVVLALSVVLINGFGPGKAPSLIDYGAFCGGAGLLIAVVGVVACFFEALQGIVMLALDGLATFFLLAGGIAFAATLKVGSCTDIVYLADHSSTLAPSTNKFYPGVGNDESKYQRAFLNDTENRCRMAQADTAMVWFLFACFAAAVVLSFMTKSRGRGSMV